MAFNAEQLIMSGSSAHLDALIGQTELEFPEFGYYSYSAPKEAPKPERTVEPATCPDYSETLEQAGTYVRSLMGSYSLGNPDDGSIVDQFAIVAGIIQMASPSQLLQGLIVISDMLGIPFWRGNAPGARSALLLALQSITPHQHDPAPIGALSSAVMADIRTELALAGGCMLLRHLAMDADLKDLVHPHIPTQIMHTLPRHDVAIIADINAPESMSLEKVAGERRTTTQLHLCALVCLALQNFGIIEGDSAARIFTTLQTIPTDTLAELIGSLITESQKITANDHKSAERAFSEAEQQLMMFQDEFLANQSATPATPSPLNEAALWGHIVPPPTMVRIPDTVTPRILPRMTLSQILDKKTQSNASSEQYQGLVVLDAEIPLLVCPILVQTFHSMLSIGVTHPTCITVGSDSIYSIALSSIAALSEIDDFPTFEALTFAPIPTKPDSVPSTSIVDDLSAKDPSYGLLSALTALPSAQTGFTLSCMMTRPVSIHPSQSAVVSIWWDRHHCLTIPLSSYVGVGRGYTSTTQQSEGDRPIPTTTSIVPASNVSFSSTLRPDIRYPDYPSDVDSAFRTIHSLTVRCAGASIGGVNPMGLDCVVLEGVLVEDGFPQARADVCDVVDVEAGGGQAMTCVVDGTVFSEIVCIRVQARAAKVSDTRVGYYGSTGVGIDCG